MKPGYILAVAFLLVLFLSCQGYAFHLPDVKKGLALKTVDRLSVTPTLAFEVFELDFPSYNLQYDFFGVMRGDLGKWLGRWNIDAGIGNDLVFVSFSKILVPVVEIQLGIFWGYDFDRFDGGFETGFILSGILW